jgi:hypothetical protein
MAKRRVLLTGAAGYISSQLLPVFRERYDLVLLDVTSEGKQGPIEDILEADLSDPDVDRYREHFRGADAVVHNAWNSYGAGMGGVLLPQWLPPDPDTPPRPTDDYYEERTNVDMVFHVLKVARIARSTTPEAAMRAEAMLQRRPGRLCDVEADREGDGGDPADRHAIGRSAAITNFIGAEIALGGPSC